eukprot:366140_1
MVGAGVGDDEDAGLHELSLDLVGERTGDESVGEEVGTDVLGELEGGALAEQAGGADADVLGVLDGDEDAGGEDQLLPGHVEVEDVDAILGAAEDVVLHRVAAVLGAEVHVGGKHLLHVALRGAEHLRAGLDGGHSYDNKVQKL